MSQVAGKEYCDYCWEEAKLVTGAEIYPHRPDLAHKRFWSCEPCKAFVGCHPGTEKSLGRLANKRLRAAKQRAHAAFDPIWKSGRMGRREAYVWLAQELAIPEERCHIGMFDEKTCEEVVRACEIYESPVDLDEPGFMWTDNFW